MAADASADDTPLTCLVVADHQLCGQAIGGLLSEQCGLELVAVCSSVADALVLMEHSPPGLLLLDIFQPGEHWQDAAAALQHLNPEGRLIMLRGLNTKFVPPEEILPILLGIVDKCGAWDDLIGLVTRWEQQKPSPSLRRRAPALVPLERLSPRELRVFYALGKGMHNKEIAKSLGLSVNTVETYRKIISGKLGLSGVELVRAAVLQRCTNSALIFNSTTAGHITHRLRGDQRQQHPERTTGDH
jgi:DNA-binding NarL/FixJ family response regulator